MSKDKACRYSAAGLLEVLTELQVFN